MNNQLKPLPLSEMPFVLLMFKSHGESDANEGVDMESGYSNAVEAISSHIGYNVHQQVFKSSYENAWRSIKHNKRA